MCLHVSARLRSVGELLRETDELLQVVASAARRTRERAGLTIRDLAATANVGTTIIGNFETGRSWPAPGVKRRRLEKGYGWAPEAIDRMQAGDLSDLEVTDAPLGLAVQLADHEARITALETALGFSPAAPVAPGSDVDAAQERAVRLASAREAAASPSPQPARRRDAR